MTSLSMYGIAVVRISPVTGDISLIPPSRVRHMTRLGQFIALLKSNDIGGDLYF